MAAQENQESTTEKFELPSDGRMVLRTENLVKKYGKRTVVSHVSINVKQGEIVGLLGPNGAGKTTSFYMTTGLIVPNEGHIYLNDKDITSYPVYKRAQNGIGYLAQEASVFRKMSVEDNIASVLELTNKSPEYQKEKLESLIAAAAEPQMEDQAFGIRDYGLDTYSAVRYGSDGIVEIIPLAITGNRVVENLEPNAYALYIACFTEVMGYDLEAEFDCPIKPLNIRRTPLAEFLGVDEGVFEGATLTASRLDCEAGYIDIEIDEEETGEKIEWLSGLVVTGKRNALCVTGNTEVYTLHSPEGAFLARFEFYQGLLVMDDGMYAVETWAE